MTARRARKAAYYSVRRNAQRSANRRLSQSLLAFALAVGLSLVSRLLPREAAQPPLATPVAVAEVATRPTLAEPMPSPFPTPAVAATAVISPTARPLDAPLVETPTVGATPIPEPTSSLVVLSPVPDVATPATTTTTTTSTATLQSPLALATSVPPNRRLVLRAIAGGVGAGDEPLETGTTFPAGQATIYIFFDFHDVPPSALLRHTWFRDGDSVFFRSQRLIRNGSGTSYISWSPAGGFRPGLYEVRIMLGGVLQFVANFEVRQRG